MARHRFCSLEAVYDFRVLISKESVKSKTQKRSNAKVGNLYSPGKEGGGGGISEFLGGDVPMGPWNP